MTKVQGNGLGPFASYLIALAFAHGLVDNPVLLITPISHQLPPGCVAAKRHLRFERSILGDRRIDDFSGAHKLNRAGQRSALDASDPTVSDECQRTGATGRRRLTAAL